MSSGCWCRGLHLTMVTGTGSVEQFFSFSKYTDTDQRHAMSDNARHVACMAHYGEAEGRLDSMPVLKALVQCTCCVLCLVLEQQLQFYRNFSAILLHCCQHYYYCCPFLNR